MTEDTTYNGWKNHATWCVNLHLSNDEPLYRETLERTAETLKNPPHLSEYWNEEQTARYNVADMLKDWIEEMTTMSQWWRETQRGEVTRLLIQDLIGGYLSDVDWHELADVWIGQVRELAV